MADDWIAGAVPKSHEGLFARKAHAVGKTTREYAEEKAHASGTLGREANFARTVMGLPHGKKRRPYKAAGE